MKSILLLTMVAVIFLAGAIFATQVSAQYQPGSGQGQYQGRQGQFQGTSTPVNGTTYANTNFGVQVSIPSGWSGMEIKRTSGATTLMLALGGFQSMQGGQRPPVTISLSMIPISSTPNAPHFGQRNSQYSQTCTNSTTTKTVNSFTFNEMIIQCIGDVTTKSQNDKTQTSSAYVTLGLRADSTSDFDLQIATFETMLGTLHLTTPSSATTPAVTTIPSIATPSQIVIPTWVKKNAGYWATGTVGDSDFVAGIQYLVQQKIMKIPSSASTTTNSSSNQIPKWIKTNAGWWASGQLTDDDFVKGIQYLISSNIMKIS